MPSFLTRAPLFLALFLLASCDIPTEPEGVNQEGLTLLGEQMQKQGNDEAAADFYQRALQRKPGDTVAMLKLGDLFEAHGQVEVAENYYARGLQIKPDDAALLHADGRVLVMLGRADAARVDFEKLVDRDSSDVRAQNGLGVALDYLGRHDEAEEHYQAALETSPDDLRTISNLGHSYVLAGKYDQAIAVLEPHAADPKAAPAYRQNLAEAYGLSGMYADAERMARMDLKPADVKRNLAFYRARRAKLGLDQKLVADLGTYPTNEMAEARAAAIRDMMDDASVTIQARPQIGSIGGTPSFVLQATGFKTTGEMQKFCHEIAHGPAACKNTGN